MKWDGSIIFLGTDDLEQVDQFYRGFLKLPLYKDQELCKIYNIEGGGKIGFCSHLEKKIAPKSPIITLLTDDVDGVFAEIRESKYEIIEAPRHNKKFNIYHFFLRDPSGYCVEIQKFL